MTAAVCRRSRTVESSSLSPTHTVLRYKISHFGGIQSLALKGKGSPYSITERRVPELILVLGSQPAGDVSHKPGSRLSLLSAGPAVTTAVSTLKKAATNFAAW